MTILGIDPGEKGGFAFMVDSVTVRLQVMPMIGNNIDIATIRHWLLTEKPDHVMIERQQAMSKPGASRGATSTFTTGYRYGVIIGCLETLQMPYEVAQPQKWQREILGIFPKGKSKERALAYVQRAFPQVPLLATDRCRTPHDGLVDALCIAEYGRRFWK